MAVRKGQVWSGLVWWCFGGGRESSIKRQASSVVKRQEHPPAQKKKMYPSSAKPARMSEPGTNGRRRRRRRRRLLLAWLEAGDKVNEARSKAGGTRENRCKTAPAASQLASRTEYRTEYRVNVVDEDVWCNVDFGVELTETGGGGHVSQEERGWTGGSFPNRLVFVTKSPVH